MGMNQNNNDKLNHCYHNNKLKVVTANVGHYILAQCTLRHALSSLSVIANALGLKQKRL